MVQPLFMSLLDAIFGHVSLLKTLSTFPLPPVSQDLVPTLQRLLEDDAFAQGIARNAQALAAQRLRPSGSYCYLTKALQRLHAAVDGSVGRAEVVQSKTEFMEVEEIDLREVVGFVPLRDRLDLIKMDRTGCRKRSGAVSGLLPVGGTGSSRQPRSGRQALFEEADPLEVTALAALQKFWITETADGPHICPCLGSGRGHGALEAPFPGFPPLALLRSESWCIDKNREPHGTPCSYTKETLREEVLQSVVFVSFPFSQ